MAAKGIVWSRIFVTLWIACCVLAVPAFSQTEKLQVMIWETDELDTDALFDAIRTFTRATFVGVELLAVPFAEYREQLLARLMGGNAPDLFWASPDLLRELAEAGLVLPLDAAVSRLPEIQVSRTHRFDSRLLGIQVGASLPFSDIAYAVPLEKARNVEIATKFIGFIQQRWSVICCFHIIQPNPSLNTAIAAHGNTDWHIDTANEFLFGIDMGGATTATNHCPSSWTRTHIHVGLTNTNHFYYDSDRITPGDDTDTTSGIDTAMLFFYAGHGFPPSSWDTLGNRANVSNVSLGDDPGWGMLRYYWQCSCTVFAHGPSCCAGDTCSTYHPCPSGQDWWYQCPEQFTGASDSLTTPNVYERWGGAINPNLRMACGSSTCAYCHEGQMNSIWNNYNNLGYDVADSFIDGLRTGNVVPLCISMGGYNINLNPLVADSTFTNQPNTSGTSHYYIQYLSYFASHQIGGMLHAKLPEFLPKQLIVRPGPIPREWREEEFRVEKEWMMTWDEIEDRGPRVRINQMSGAMYVAGPTKSIVGGPEFSEQAYIDLARRHADELGWSEELVSEPMGLRMMIVAVPAESQREQTLFQKNVMVYLKRLVDVDGEVVPVLGEGGVIEIQMNNDGSLLNASKIWREVIGFEKWEPVKTYEEALSEALAKTDRSWAYEVDDWAWGYVEAAGDDNQETMQLVFRFWLTPLDQEQLRDLPPMMVEVSA